MTTPYPVFISYSRAASAAQARALAEDLGPIAFFDTAAIDDGDRFPEHLLNGILDASIVVIFATESYVESRFCQLEMRLALASGAGASSHVVLALGEGSSGLLEVLPSDIATQSWPEADATSRLQALVDRRLKTGVPSIRQLLSVEEARRMSALFLDESRLPAPQSLDGIPCSFPPGVGMQSIGARFVGRADLLRQMHRMLITQRGGASASVRLSATGGHGKTRLATEYVCRYGRHHAGGIFWVNAASTTFDVELWRVLKALDETTPELPDMRGQNRDVRGELERALRSIRQPALFIVDNIPESSPAADPPAVSDFCPAMGAVTTLATSRQDAPEAGVQTLSLETLERDAAVLLLTDNVQGAAAVAWDAWGRITDWVGALPIALDLLNRSLALGAVTPRVVLARIEGREQAGTTGELDRMRDALRGQVPRDAVHGITETFAISFERLDPTSQRLAVLLAQLAPAPIPELFMEALSGDWNGPGARAALRSRHFVTSGDNVSFGVMHRLVADYLRTLPAGSENEPLERAGEALATHMTVPRCQDPREWPLMRLCRPHAESLFERAAARNPASLVCGGLAMAAAVLDGAQGDDAGARKLNERLLDVWTRAFGPDHFALAMPMNNLAATLSNQGLYADALKLQERVLAIMRRDRGDDDMITLRTMSNLAMRLHNMGNLTEAIRINEQVLDARMRTMDQRRRIRLRP